MTTTPPSICLTHGAVDLETLRAIYHGGVTLTLAEEAWADVDAACQQVADIVR
ncbi:MULTISPECIES: hypothetical protein [Symbiopectobacterium]|uniref:hypothetical protein n=1 Tax=Candidatus Symbiopectobacterium sp. PLON1 TaxID=2794575 RepID=UPI00207A0B1D|nr:MULTISPECIES: hypothetical protein [Symbiopectobacterium]